MPKLLVLRVPMALGLGDDMVFLMNSWGTFFLARDLRQCRKNERVCLFVVAFGAGLRQGLDCAASVCIYLLLDCFSLLLKRRCWSVDLEEESEGAIPSASRTEFRAAGVRAIPKQLIIL